jgi:hypothetical protein
MSRERATPLKRTVNQRSFYMEQTVSTTTIVNEMQQVINDTKANEKLDFEKKVKIIFGATAMQLRAGALNLGYARAAARLPENAASAVPLLNAAPPSILPPMTKQ